jgi:hypothetical protein
MMRLKDQRKMRIRIIITEGKEEPENKKKLIRLQKTYNFYFN